MSLSELVRQQQIDGVVENAVKLTNRNNNERLKCTLWFDSGMESGHGPRFKVSLKDGFKSSSCVSVSVPSMKVEHKIPKEFKSDEIESLPIVIDFMSRRALQEAVWNMWRYEKTCGLNPDQMCYIVKELLLTWREGDSDDYDSDLEVIRRYAPNYDPKPMNVKK